MLGYFHADSEVERSVIANYPAQILGLKVAWSKTYRFHQKTLAIYVITVEPDSIVDAEVLSRPQPRRDAAANVDHRFERRYVEQHLQDNMGRCQAARGLLVEKLMRVDRHFPDARRDRAMVVLLPFPGNKI